MSSATEDFPTQPPLPKEGLEDRLMARIIAQDDITETKARARAKLIMDRLAKADEN